MKDNGGRPEEETLLAISNCRWLDNIKMNIGLEILVWTGLIWLKIGII
jgi:hypothetical protein